MPDTTYRYRTQHLRGTADTWKEVGQNIIPRDGEIVVELGDKKHYHRLKIGDGENSYKDLSYISTDDVVLPKKTITTIYGGDGNWNPVKNGDNILYYTQSVSIENGQINGIDITPKSKIDIQLTPAELMKFYNQNFSFMYENKNGNIQILCVGDIPSDDISVSITIAEVIMDIPDGPDDLVVYGNLIGTSNPQADWNQANPNKADFIKNKPMTVIMRVWEEGAEDDIIKG